MGKRVIAIAALIISLLLHPNASAQVRDDDSGEVAAEIATRLALEAFIAQWNTGENVNLRRTMNFPFVTVAAGGNLIIDLKPEDFSQDFNQLRDRQGWDRSSFEFNSLSVIKSSPEKVHVELDFTRYSSDGTAYMGSRVFYIATKQNDHWGLQLRTGAATPIDLDSDERDAIVNEARQVVLNFFTAFNAGDVEGTVATLNYPHVFMLAGGGFNVSAQSSDGPRPNFELMRQGEGWHMSSVDTLEASIVTRDKVHFELVFTRWHPNGTRYWTVPALWIVTREGDQWGIQVRSLMPATFDARRN